MYGFKNVLYISQNIYRTTSKIKNAHHSGQALLLQPEENQPCEETVFHEGIQVFSYKPQERYQDGRQDATNQNKESWLK